jgi:NAD(P)-dependent dehydrogenase (short-subunit alcohol dehydrogenase family)
MHDRLTGKTAIITGGGGRIGAATARRLVQEGANVAIADLSEEAAQRVADELGEAAIAIQFDAGEPDSIAAMVAHAADHFGRIDILHNNAALLDLAFLDRDRDAVQTDVDVWDRTMEVNVRGYMIACKHAIPHMRRQGGRLYHQHLVQCRCGRGHFSYRIWIVERRNPRDDEIYCHPAWPRKHSLQRHHAGADS